MARGRARRLVAAALALVTGAGPALVPVSLVAAGAAAITAASVAVAPAPAKASLSGSVLILSTSVSGGSSSAEAQAASALGLSVTVASASTWDSMTQSQFGSYKVIIIGDPSGSSCSASVPSDALSTTGTWEPAVSGDVAIVGTAPALAGTSGAKALISDAIAYAASGAGTGLYVSLNCEDSSDSAGTPVGGSGSAKNWLSGVEGIGKAGGLTATGQGSGCPAGSVNAQEALAAGAFNGLSSSELAGWPSPACGGQETFNSWPASFTPVAYVAAGSLTGGSGSADFTASDGASGQPLVLLGAPISGSTAGLTPSQGGQVPAFSAVGGLNPAAPGVHQATAGDPVNTENGDFSQSNTDLSIPTFGPDLSFSRTYDAQLAQQQATAGTPVPPGAPGSLGYGWTDNWDTWLSSGRTAPGDIFTIDGLATNTGNQGPATSAAMNSPDTVSQSGGNTYIADTAGNRIEEVPSASGTQWGIAMTAGHMYTVVGSDTGASGVGSNGTPMGSFKLNAPQGITVDSAGDLLIADTDNNRVLEVPAASGTNYGTSMTADDVYTVAGHASPGHSGDGGSAISAFLNGPTEVITQGTGSDATLYIADAGNNRVQEVFESGGNQWSQSMTADDIYTVAGNASGTGGNNGAGGPATSALLTDPKGVSLSGDGNLYIAVTGNNKIQEVAKSSGTQWNNQSMTANDIYNVAGNAGGTAGVSPNGTVNTSTLLDNPTSVVMNNGQQMYITDGFNSRIVEIARTSHTDFGISMTANDLYDIAGSAAGTAGYSGNGRLATSALLNIPAGAVGFSGSGMYVGDTLNNQVRFVAYSTGDISDFAGGAGTFSQDGDGGVAVDAGLSTPEGMTSDSHGDIYIADTVGNRVQEIAAYAHTQFGINMTAGDVYTIAGSAGGYSGLSGDGGLATSALLFQPYSVAVDSAGNVYIADTENFRVQKVSASTGDISTFAGSATGVNGDSGQGGLATSALLNQTYGVAADPAGDVFIASNEQILEVPAASGTNYGIAMTASHIYTIAGNAAGNTGVSGDGGPATSAFFDAPNNVAVDLAGNVYVGDYFNNRVQEIAATTHAQFGVSMTKNDIYTVAGSASGSTGSSGDGGPATSALLNGPEQVTVDSSGNLYIADSNNYKVREVAAANGTQWGQSMTANDIYTIAGTGTQGDAGDGGPATSAQLSSPQGITTDPSGDVYITNLGDNRLREITATPSPLFTTSPAPGTTWSISGITITQPGGSQVTFYPQKNGACASSGQNSTAPYTQVAGGYCALPQYTAVNLSYSSGNGGSYTYTPRPGQSYIYGANGALQSESDAAGNTLNVSYGTPLPGSGHCPSVVLTVSVSVCNTITSASGRALVVAYSSASLVLAVTDPLGRQWSYSYTGSDLTKVTDPMSNVTTYTYDSGNAKAALTHDMLSITSPNAQPGGPDAGDATVNQYDSLGRVTQQTDPMGYVTKFNYCVNAATGKCMNASTGSGFVTVTNPDGNTTVDAYGGGALIAESTWTGGTTRTSEHDFVPDQTVTTGDNSAATQLDTASADGNRNVTRYTYDIKGNLTGATDPLGDTLSRSAAQGLTVPSCSADALASPTNNCVQNPGPPPAAPGGVITPPSSAPPLGLTLIQYDTDGNQLWSTTGVYKPGASTASYSQTAYQLFKGNSVTLNGTNIVCTATPPSASLPCATIDPDGVATQLAYNQYGDLTSSSTPDRNPGNELATTTYSYDGDGEQIASTSPDGNLSGANAGNYTTVTAWNGDRQQTSVSEGDGSGHSVTPRTTNHGYDGNGNQVTVQDPRGYTTTTTYNANDQATLVTDPVGNQTLTCYDGAGNVAQTVPPVGVAANNLTAASCPTSYPSGYGTRLASDASTYTFDANGNQTQTTTPAPVGQSGYETTSYAYDADGNLVQVTAPPASTGGPNQVTVSTYDGLGQLASQTTGYGTSAASTVSYCYDPNGNKTAVVYADGNTSGVASCETSYPWVVSSSAYPTQASYQTSYAYDSAGELVSTTTPATTAAPTGGTTTSTYDAAGNELTSTDPNGVTTSMTYTPGGQIAAASYSGSTSAPVSYSYDASGNRTGITDGSGTSTYVYDSFSELASAQNGAGKTVTYGHDADGDVTGITYPLGSPSWAATSTVAYGFNNADVLTSVTDFNNHQIAITPNADSFPASETLGSTGDTITNTFDPAGTLSAIALKSGSTTLQSFSYTDGPAKTVASETDLPTSSRSPASYTYDARGHVTSMTPGSGSQLNYGYDASGNLTTLPSGADASHGGYDKAGELISSVLAGTTTSYTYNADGERLTTKNGSSTITSATWNGAGELTSYSGPAATMTAATYNGDGLRSSATSTSAQSFTWNTISPNPQLLVDSNNAYIYGGDGAVAEQVSLSTGSPTYLVTDALGSVRGIVSSSGALTATTSYDAWGNPQTAGGLSAYTPFGFAGGYTDPDGLIYLINRYYDPQTGQFLSVDPMVGQTLAPYAYADGNPVSSADPSGLFRQEKTWGYDPHSYTLTWQMCLTLGNKATTVAGQVCVGGTYTHTTDRGHLHLKCKFLYLKGSGILIDWFETNYSDQKNSLDDPFFGVFARNPRTKHFYYRWHGPYKRDIDATSWGTGKVYAVSRNCHHDPRCQNYVFVPPGTELHSSLWAVDTVDATLYIVYRNGFSLNSNGQ